MMPKVTSIGQRRLAKSCWNVRVRYEKRGSCMRFFLVRAVAHVGKRKEAETKKLIATVFLQRFTLTTEEVEAITERDVSVGSRF